MKGFLRWVWSFLEIIIILYVIVLTSFLLCKNKYGYTQFGDYTLDNVSLFDEKNNKNLKKGDLLIVKNSNDIHEGDVVYYYAVYNENYIIKSGSVTEIKSDDYSSLYTIDDNGPISVVGTKILGKYSNTYPHLGSILSVLESRLGFLFCVLLPIMVVFIYQVYEFVIIIRYERVDHSEKESTQTKQKDDSNDSDVEIL